MRKSSNHSRSSHSRNRSLFSDDDFSDDDNASRQSGGHFSGYDHLESTFHDEAFDIPSIHQSITDFISNLLPQAILLRDFNGNFVYQIPLKGFNAERLFIEMEKNKERLRIADWGIS